MDALGLSSTLSTTSSHLEPSLWSSPTLDHIVALARIFSDNVFSQLLGITIYDWKWRSHADPAAFEPWADIVGTLLVSPSLLLPPLAALLVLYQHRDNLTSVLKPTHLWRKNALKQNKKDKYRGEERSFRYNLRSDQLQREKKTNSVISDA